MIWLVSVFGQVKKDRALTRNLKSSRVLPVIAADQLTGRGAGNRSRRWLEDCSIDDVDRFLSLYALPHSSFTVRTGGATRALGNGRLSLKASTVGWCRSIRMRVRLMLAHGRFRPETTAAVTKGHGGVLKGEEKCNGERKKWRQSRWYLSKGPLMPDGSIQKCFNAPARSGEEVCTYALRPAIFPSFFCFSRRTGSKHS